MAKLKLKQKAPPVRKVKMLLPLRADLVKSRIMYLYRYYTIFIETGGDNIHRMSLRMYNPRQ